MFPLKKGKEIETLIAQREPIVMVDALYDYAENEADTGLTITQENLFCDGQQLTETGLIEHIAQSASVFVGYKAWLAGKPIAMGYIGEVKKFKLNTLPKIGQEIQTKVKLLHEVMGLLLMEAQTFVNGQMIVNCQMKLFLNPA
ncbi:MAG: hydroxymyristoyl-ACP dehydratase [Bacteroidales bacterium]|jgi:3-hydroxymyristoyl/3-hydroxydecanoyl-(acyl carrier protein) dehydratase|nr:hydroxymyristoyl-ACP dehydratase [Bacteroidales bacterium]